MRAGRRAGTHVEADRLGISRRLVEASREPQRELPIIRRHPALPDVRQQGQDFTPVRRICQRLDLGEWMLDDRTDLAFQPAVGLGRRDPQRAAERRIAQTLDGGRVERVQRRGIRVGRGRRG